MQELRWSQEANEKRTKSTESNSNSLLQCKLYCLLYCFFLFLLLFPFASSCCFTASFNCDFHNYWCPLQHLQPVLVALQQVTAEKRSEWAARPIFLLTQSASVMENPIGDSSNKFTGEKRPKRRLRRLDLLSFTSSRWAKWCLHIHKT